MDEPIKDLKGGYHSPRISSEYQDCSLPLTFDQYSLCSFGCKYCFAVYQKSNNPSFNGTLRSVNAESVKKQILGKGTGEYANNFLTKRFPLHIGGLADPFDGHEKCHGVMYDILESAVQAKYPIIFSTKGTLAKEGKYLSLLKEAAPNKQFAFQFSMITGVEDYARKIEVGVPSVEERLATMKVLSDLGYWTIMRLRPFIIGISSEGLDDFLERAKNAGMKAISTEFFCLELRCNETMRKMYDTISEVAGYNIYDYYKALSPSERGTYLRLNRDVKEQYIRQIYEFCKKNGIQFNTSDPDFKELNQSGSCCGLPELRDKYNSELVNWNRGQLTHLIKEARRRYWEEGKATIGWKDIMENSFDKGAWMFETRYYNDSLKCFHDKGTLKNMSHGFEFQQVWNNLGSPKNPYYYFHGKLKPCGVENDMLEYKYVPSPYEYRWKEEGLL